MRGQVYSRVYPVQRNYFYITPLSILSFYLLNFTFLIFQQNFKILNKRFLDPTVLILTFAALACILAAPDTTTLVTLGVQSSGGNDSVSLVQVRSRLYFPIYFPFCFRFYFPLTLFLKLSPDPLFQGRTWKCTGLTLNLCFACSTLE